MQPRQMADSFFGFDTSLGAALDGGLDCLDDEDIDGNYDALNDETFGSEANTGDWEQAHEQLAQITESSRPRNRHENNKSESEIDVEKSLSHLVLDEKEVTIPRPGVWDSPNFAIPPPQIKPSLSALKNACTVEELERGLITNRPPPGLVKPPGPPQIPPSNSGQNLFLNSITSAEKLQQINGTGPPQNQFPIIIPPNVRLPPPHLNLQNVRPMPNAPGNILRYPLPLPHLLMPPGGQRQPPLHGNFPFNNFPHSGNPGMGPLPFGMRPDHPLMPPYPNNQQAMNQHLHMANQRNQNKQFNDRQDNHHQPFFRNNQFPHQNHNHMNRFFGNQGPFPPHMFPMNHHHNLMQMSNGIGPYGEIDEYAGLMNNREKQWLNNIQLLQLNTNQPYIDDYYYTVFCDRLNKKNEIKNLNKNRKMNNNKGNGNNNNNGFHKDSRDNKEQPSFTKAATPMQFENSLGKLQYSSVTAPRKIIDMDVVPNSDPQQASSQQKDTKKTRQLLLEIERLYLLLLKLEDKTNPLAIIAEQQREQQQREQLMQQHAESGEPMPEIERRDLLKEKEELTLSIMTSLLQLAQEDKLSSLLSIRKGKTLVLRFLPFMNIKEHRDKMTELWRAVIKGLPVIGRRDTNLLMNFYVEFYKWAEENCIKPFSMYRDLLHWRPMASLVTEFIESTNQPTKTNSVTFALSNKFGISVLALMIKHGRDISCLNSKKWDQFVKAIAESIGNSSPIVSPCELLDKNNLDSYLRQFISSPQQLAAFELFFTEANPTR